MAERYANRSEAEARAYLAHPALGPNLHRCVDALLTHDPLDPHAILGSPDELKLRSSMTLFEAVGEGRLHVDARATRYAPVQYVHTVDVTSRPTVVTTVPTGRLVIATIEVTLLDLVAHPKRSGGFGNIATIVANAIQDDRIDAQRIVETASSYRPAVAQRLGFVIERAAKHLMRDVDLEAMVQFVRGRRTVPLDLRAPAHGSADPRWRVLVNAPLEIDA
jgi:hypothetical protein